MGIRGLGRALAPGWPNPAPSSLINSVAPSEANCFRLFLCRSRCGVLDFTFDDYETEPERMEVVHEIKLKNQNNKVFYDKLTFIYLEMPNFEKTEDQLETRLDKWRTSCAQPNFSCRAASGTGRRRIARQSNGKTTGRRRGGQRDKHVPVAICMILFLNRAQRSREQFVRFYGAKTSILNRTSDL